MANGGSIRYNIGFNIDKSGLNQLKSSLQEIKMMTAQDFMKITGGNDLSKAQKELKEIHQTLGKVDAAFESAFNSDLGTLNIAKFNQTLSNSGLTIQKIHADLARTGTAGQNAFRNMTSQILTTNMKLKESHTLIDSMATTMANTIKWGAASSVMNSFTGTVRRAYGYVKSLDGSLNDIRIVTGKSADEMDRFAEKANKAAKNLGQTTTNYTDAALIYYQQGLSDAEVQARAEVTLKAANVTGQSGAEVSEQLTAVWNGYKVSAEEAELYIDKLAAVAAKTAANLEELSTGMSKVASAANLMGVDVDQLNAQLATIVSVTRQAPESVGTALKTIYARMGDIEAGLDSETTLGDYTEKMAEMGVNVLDMNGKLRDMGEVMEEIGGKWTSMSREQQIYLSQVMAGTRQYNNLLALFDNWGQYTKALETSSNAAGTLQEQQDIYMESTQAHLAQLKASWEDLYDSLLDADSINGVSDALSGIVSLMANFVDSIGGGSNVLLALGSIGGQVFSKHLANGIATFITNLQLAKDNATQLRAEMAILNQYEGANLQDTRTQVLVDMKRKILDLDKNITAEERNIANEYIKQQNELFKQQDVLEARKAAAMETYNKVATDPGDINNPEDAKRMAKKLDQRATDIEGDINSTKIEGFDNALKKLNETRQKYNDLARQSTDNSNELIQAEKKLEQAALDHNKTIETQIKLAQEVAANDDFEEKNKKELIETLETLEKMRSKDGSLNLKNAQVVKQIQKVEEARVKTYKNQAEGSRRAAKEMLGFADASRKGKESVDQLQGSYNSWISRLDLRNKIQQGIQLASSFGQVASAISSIGNIPDIWGNQDLSTGEKVLQTVTSLGFALPMLANSLGQVSKVLGIGTSITQAYTAAQMANKITSEAVNAITAKGITLEQAKKLALLQTLGTEEAKIEVESIIKMLSAGKISQETAEIAINKLLAASNIEVGESAIFAGQGIKTFLKNLGPIFWAFAAIGAISGAIALIDKFTISAKEAGENLLESAEKFKEFENELQSVESELQTTKDRIEELLKIADSGELSITEEQELIRLEAQNIALEEQINLIKEKQALESKKVAQNAEIALEKGTYDTYVANNPFKGYDYSTAPKYAAGSQNNISTDSGVPGYAAVSPGYAAVSQNYNSIETYYDKGTAGKFLSTEGFEKQIWQIELNDPSTFNIWKESMEKLEQEALTNANESESGSKDELGWKEVADAIDKAIEDTEKRYNSQKRAYIDELSKGFDAAVEALPSLRENNTDGQYDETIKYYEDIVYNYKKQMGTLDGIVEDSIENLALTENQKMSLKTSKDVLDRENEEVNEDVLEDIIGTKNVEKLKIYSEELNLSMYDIVNRYQEMSELVGLSNEEIKQKLAEIRQEKIEDIVEQANEDYKGVAKDDLTSETFEAAGLTDEQIENWEAVSQYLDETTIETEGWVEALKEAAGEYQKIEDAKNFETSLNKNAEKYSEVYDIDEETYKNLTETIHGTSEALEGLNEYVEANGEVAQEVAKDLLRYDKACEKVKDSSEDWMDALENGNIQDQAEAIEEMRKAYGNMLDIDGSSLSSDFLTNAENLRLMQEAANGSEEAYNVLQEAAAKDILIQCGIDTAKFEQDKALLYSTIVDGTAFPDLEVGASLNDEKFLQELTNMVNAAGMTAEQATDYLSSMGVDAEIEQHETTASDNNNFVGAEAVVTTEPITYVNPITGEEVPSNVPSISYTPIDNPIKSDKKQTSFSLKVTSASKSSGGGFKYKNTSHGGGSKGSGSGKKSGGGGGGSKAKNPDKMGPIKKERDRYHDINNELKKLNTQFERQDSITSKLTGKDRIAALNKQIELLDQQNARQQEKLNLLRQEQAELQNTLKAQGVNFDAEGDIANFNAALQAKENYINGLINRYNSMSAEEQEAFKETIEKAKEDYEQFKENMDRYEEVLLDEIPEMEDSINEALDQKIEFQIEAMEIEVELKLDLQEAKRQLNDFIRDFVDKIKDDDFLGIQEAAMNSIPTYLGNDGTVQTNLSAFQDALDAYETIKNGGTDDVFGDDAAAALDSVLKYRDETINAIEETDQLLEEVQQNYLDGIEAANEAFDEHLDKYQQINDQLEHNLTLVELLAGEEAYEAQLKYYSQMEQNNLARLDFAKKEVDFWKERMAAEEEGSEAWKIAQQNAIEAQENLNGLIEESIELAQTKFEATVKSIIKEMNDNFTGGLGLEYVAEEWELINKEADMYLDTINSAYEVQKLENKFLKAIDETSSLKAQQRLNDLMDEELDKLREKDKLTQYEVDRANALFDLELKKIALEEAQRNKSTMRLRRDSQGNYSYQYVSDQDAIADAQAETEEAQNSLYNLDKEAYQENLDQLLSIYTEWQEKVEEINIKYKDDEIKRQEQLALVNEHYGNIITGLTKQNTEIRNNLMSSTFAELSRLRGIDLEEFQNLSDEEKRIIMESMVPQWNNGVQIMADKFIGDGTGSGFIDGCEVAFGKLNDATTNYQQSLDNLANAAGVDLEMISTGQQTLLSEIEQLTTDNDILIGQYEETLSKLEDNVRATEDWVKACQDLAREAANAMAKVIALQQAESARAASSGSRNSNSGGNGGFNKNNSNSSSRNKNNENSGSNTDGSRNVSSDGNKNSNSKVDRRPPYYYRTSSDGKSVSIYFRDKISVAAEMSANDLLRHPVYKNATRFKTGGYTGEWTNGDRDGRLALLHQKELVLNAEDTRNILNTVDMVRSLNDSMNSRMFNLFNASAIDKLYNLLAEREEAPIEQNIEIHASFPGVTVEREIEEAFDNLLTRMTQQVFKTKR